MSSQVHKSATDTIECNLDNSIPAQTSSILLLQSVDHSFEDEDFCGMLVPPQTSSTASHGDRYSQNKETTQDSKPGILIAVDMPLMTAELPCIDHGSGDAQRRQAGHGSDPGFHTPMAVPPVAIDPCSVVCRGGETASTEVTSVTLFQESSNVQIKDTNIIATGGNATFIQFGDGQFTEIQRNLICDYIANLKVLPDIDRNLKKHILTQSIISLPRAEAVFSDYQTKKKSGPCFEGTRVALLREMGDWVTGSDESRMYVLSGLAGIGKSTVAYTIASRASDINLLGASFFFSRDEDDRNNAKRFFTTIAYQLCVYNEIFAKAIGDVLVTERGSAATTKDPQEQLQALILEPLRSIVQARTRPILIVVDALDECDEKDRHAVVMGLTQLVRLLPSFKVILTTRPQSLVDYLFGNRDGHNIFRLEDIEGKVVDDDIRHYLSHSFSQKQVRACLLNPKERWCASDEDIESLVKAAGRLFIIASTAILYVLNKAGNPGARMKKLLGEISQDRTPFQALNRFYSVIVRTVIQVDDDVDDIVERYQNIVGTIVVIQTPLPVTALAYLVGEEAESIYAMLRNLQSVILLGSDDVPRVYHKSFLDYLTDPTRCEDPRLLIDPRIHQPPIARRCFETMDKYLKYNILDLGVPARFMNNEDGLKEEGITNKQLEKKIPQQLDYACVYWVHHLGANVEDIDLTNGFGGFVNKHILHWIEVLSLIGKLNLAHRIIGDAIKLVKLTSSDLDELLSDSLRFISQFYAIIERSALHTYYSALPFTPTQSVLYRRYIKEAIDNVFVIEGGPEKWDPVVAYLTHEAKESIDNSAVIKFSLDSSLFVSWFQEDVYKGQQEKLKIWDATTGMPISMIPGHRFAIANDFSTVVSFEDRTISYYNMNGSARGTMFTTSSTILHLALSSESNRIAAAFYGGIVLLWDSINSKLIDSFNDYDFGYNGPYNHFGFSATGTRLVYSSSLYDTTKLRDGINGRIIADLKCGIRPKFEFSGDGSRIASLSGDYAYGLRLWNSESGALIDDADVEDVGLEYLAISANGSLLVTADRFIMKLWSENNGHLAKIGVLKLSWSKSITFSVDDMLAITTDSDVKLYNVKTRSFISSLPIDGLYRSLAFSPDCTRLAIACHSGKIYLWDIRGMDASSPLLKGKTKTKPLTALALSRDRSQLACGFMDGTFELWKIDPITGTKQLRISPPHSKIKAFLPFFGQSHHQMRIRALGFSPDGKLLASGSDDRTIKLWNTKDGSRSLHGTLKLPGLLQCHIALSNSVLVAATSNDAQETCSVTLWSLDTASPIRTLSHHFNTLFVIHRVNDEVLGPVITVSIAENSALIAIANFSAFDHYDVSLFDVTTKTIIATFEISHSIHTMTFLPNNSHLVVQSYEGIVLSLDLIDKHTIESTLEHLIQLPDTPIWHGVPICHCKDKGQHYFSALFPQHKKPVPVLWIPEHISVVEWTQRSSMIALRCNDGRAIFLRLHTRHVS